MKIRITRGIYGFRKNGNLLEKNNSSAPFEVDDAEGKRLISLQVAEKVILADGAEEFTDEENGDVFNRMSSIQKKNLKNIRKEDLLYFAEALGIEKNGSKDELIERLKQYPVWAEDVEMPDGEEIPELSAEDPE